MTQPEQSEQFHQPLLVAEILNEAAGIYTQYDLYKDTKGAIEAIVPHLTPDSAVNTDFSAVKEMYSFGSIGNIGVQLKRCVYDMTAWDPNTHDPYSYEVQFQPLLDENTNKGLPISYIGFLFADDLHTRDLFKDSNTKHQSNIKYRRIGSPILLPDGEVEPDTDDDSVTNASRQFLSYMLERGAHGGEVFRATKGEDAIKLCIGLADELREVGAVDGLSEKWQNRLAAIYESKDKLAAADELSTPRETEFGQLNLTADESGIAAMIASAPNTAPYLGYRLSRDEAGGYHLESVSLLGADAVNDMDALVFEQLLRLHTTDWIPFAKD
jgi:hypothetical protein